MLCPNCGNQVTNEDIVCKHCGAAIKDAQKVFSKPKKRSRFALFFLCWAVGWLNGAHLRYLGYDEAAANYRRYSFFNPICWVWICTVHIFECLAILFGKYRTDAYGNPVRYF